MSLARLRLARAFPIIGAITVACFAGCASSTVIESRPPGARVFLNNAAVGNTPYTMTDTKIVGSTSMLRLEYPGYQPLTVAISRSEELDVLPLIAGIFLLVPLLWVMKYQASHVYDLIPAGAQPGYPGAPPPYGYPPPPSAPPEAYPPPPAGYPPTRS